MPRIDKLCDRFRGKKFITSLDMKSGYWHVPIRKEHRHRTSFIFDGKLYQWKRLPFGLMNACMFFQRAMDTLFDEFVKAGFVVVYIDDISIVSDTAEEHLEHLDRVLRLIAESGIKLRIDKCVFATEITNYKKTRFGKCTGCGFASEISGFLQATVCLLMDGSHRCRT